MLIFIFCFFIFFSYVALQMDRNIHKNLVDGITLTNNNDPLEGLFNFLDSQIEILSFYLYSELF